MPVDQTSLDRIRNATFPAARRGYDKQEVEKFLARLADWLETGAGDESRSDTVKRELERVGQRTGAILAQAEESAQQIRAEAEEEARGTINTANMQAEETRNQADAYSNEARTAADTHSRETRAQAEQEAAAMRTKAEQDARETIDAAHAQASRILEEGAQRREDIEAVIADLVRRRDDVLADTEELSRKLTGAVSEHRPSDEDLFAKPDEFDPLARADGSQVHDGSEPDDELTSLEDEATMEQSESEQEPDLRT